VVKIHHVHHSGANTPYFRKVLECLSKKTDVYLRSSGLTPYLQEGNKDEDVLCYQTFPDENHMGKFNPNLVKQTDELFKAFTGHKILICTFDDGERDSYTRFPDSKELPRIKCFPSKRFLDKYNVVLLSTISTRGIGKTHHDEFERKIKVSCKFGGGKYYHTVRESVLEQLTKFFPGLANHNFIKGWGEYKKDMQQTLIAIGAPGWGQYSGTYQLALRTGALLFAYECLNDIQFLPHAVLEDGKDFVSYNLFNFKYKLQWLLDNPNEIERIRKNGRKAFKKGYNVQKSADLFYQYLKGVL